MAHSTTCPRCGATMSDVVVTGNTLTATCDCGWTGSKTKPPRTGTATTWADGHGVWHAKVPAHPHRHEMAAYQAIRAELEARQGAEVPAFGLAVVREDAETITYRESWDNPREAVKG